MLQFHSQTEVIFNLTRLPINLFNLKTFESTGSMVLYDSILQGIKQLNINSVFAGHEGIRSEWIIVITDHNDIGSEHKLSDVILGIKNSRANLLIINCFTEINDFQILVESTQLGMVYNITSDEEVSYVLKEVEAYLCPFKEVLLK